MFNSGFPTTNFSWRDNSGASTDVLFSAPTDGLNVPFSFVMAERGQPGAIYFGGAAELIPALGSSTFDPASPYFNPSTQFATIAMAGQGINIMRLVDPAATKATVGLFLTVKSTQVTQYRKDTGGNRIVDSSGNFIPVLAADGVTPIKEPGVSLKWSSRPLLASERYNALRVQTTLVNGVEEVTYPILGFEVDSKGKYGNRQGFMLFTAQGRDSSISQALGSALYRFVPMELPTDASTTASAVSDIFGADFNDVSFKNAAVYSQTKVNYAFNYVLGSKYIDNESGVSNLPYKVFPYGANVNTVGARVIAVSPEMLGTDPYLVDLISAADFDGFEYDHVELDPDSSTVVNSASTNYASGGTDGDTSWTKFEQLVADWLVGSDHGEFTNLQQHPMTHFSDPGFSMTVKPLLFNMLSLRDNFKIDVSTQDVMRPANTKAEDIASGQALMFRAQMHPESIINGVGCCRVGIYAQAAELVIGSPYGGIVPFNLNRMIQRRDLDGGIYIRGSSGGMPGSQVTLFRRPNWVADDKPSQKITWASCINAVRHASRTVIFYPSLRTVYPNDTSLLSDDEISDRIIYMYKICRQIWAKYAGVRKPPNKLYPLIQSDINNQCAAAFSNDDVKVQATVFQTANDANLGSQISINLAVTGNLPLRTMNFNVIVGRASAQ